MASIERRLAGHPDFGRPETISQRVSARYEFALEVLSERLPGLAAPVAALQSDRTRWTWQVLRDPVVKKSLEDAIVRLEGDELGSPDELERVMELAVDRLERFPDLLPTQAEEGGGLRTGPGDQVWVPRLDPADGPLTERMGRAFRDEFLTYDDKTGTVHAGGAATAERIGTACLLLAELLPLIGPDALDQVVAVVLVDAAGPRGRLLSASGGDGLPGVVALEPSQLDDPWDAAGRLLHEALHLKLFDIMRCFSLVADPSASDRMPWRDVEWDLQRVLAAFHVYSHMVLYQAAVRVHRERLTERFGLPRDNAAVSDSTGDRQGYDDASARARHLGERLDGPLARYLTSDGRRLVRWLREVTAPLTGGQSPVQNGVATGTQDGAPATVGARHDRAPNLRLHPEPELSCMFVFNERDRRLHTLNLAAWSVFELCRGQAAEDLTVEYTDLVSSTLSAAEAERHLRHGVARLVDGGLLVPAR